MRYIHKDENQEVEILKYLDKYENCWLSSDEIGKYIGLSKATVNKFIKALKNKIADKEQIDIEVVQNKGILFRCSNSIYIADLIQEIYSGSLTYKLITTILNENIISLEKFAYKNFLSVASVRRKIAYINEVLKDYNIVIKNNRFIGDEQNIRGFLFKYYWEIFKGRYWPFANVDKSKLIENSKRVSERLEIWCSQVSYEQIYYLLAISRIRLKKSHVIDYKKEFNRLTEANKMYDVAKEEWEKDFLQLHCPESELQYYFFVISSFSLNYVKTNFDKLTLLKDTYSRKNLFSFEITKWLFKKIEERYHKRDLEEKQPLLFLELVMCHSKAFIVPSQVLITSLDKEHYTMKMINSYPDISFRLRETISILVEKFPQIKGSELYLLEVYSMIYFQTLRDFFLKKVKILVSISTGRTAEKMILENLSHFFIEKYLIEETFDEQEADICITDGQFITCAKEKLVYVVDSKFTEKDYLLIENKLNR